MMNEKVSINKRQTERERERELDGFTWYAQAVVWLQTW